MHVIGVAKQKMGNPDEEAGREGRGQIGEQGKNNAAQNTGDCEGLLGPRTLGDEGEEDCISSPLSCFPPFPPSSVCNLSCTRVRATTMDGGPRLGRTIPLVYFDGLSDTNTGT